MASDNHLANGYTSANGSQTGKDATDCDEREVVVLKPQ